MARIVGTKAATELAITRAGANQHSHVLLRKSMVQPTAAPDPATQPGNPDMDLAIIKRVASMNDVTKAHFTGLNDADATAYLAKSAEDQDKIAAEAKKAAADAEAAKAKAAPATTTVDTAKADEQIAALTKTVGDLTEVVKGLAGQIESRGVESEVAKAMLGDFKGFPGGVDALMPLYKAASEQKDETTKKALMDALKSSAAMARMTGSGFGLTSDPDFVAKAMPATAKVNAEVEKRVAKGITKHAALAEIAQESEWSEAVMEAENEQQSLLN